MLPRISAAIALVATLAYPLMVYFGFGRVEPFWLAVALVALVLVRAWATRDTVWLCAAGGAAILALASCWGAGWMPLKLYPVLVSGVLLVVFSTSVLRPPTVVERMARIADPGLTAEGVRYTRTVTLVWCAFFACNGLLALATALLASNEVWLLYNGFVSYVLMGCVFAIEWLVRQRVKARIVQPVGGRAHG